MYRVVVIDRDAGWRVEQHGPLHTRQEAEHLAKQLRGDYARRPPLITVRDARNLNDSYDVRVVEETTTADEGSQEEDR